MNIATTLKTSALLAASLWAASPVLADTLGPELVVNGGFEDNVNTPNATGWTFTAAASGSRAAAVPVGAHSGSNSFFFGSGGDYDILSQSFATVAFAEYEVQAWVSVDNFIDPSNIANSLLAGFGPANFFLIQDVASTKSHFLLTRTIFAIAPVTTLGFWGANASGNFYVDDVSVRQIVVTPPVPEPQTYGLLLAGLGAIGLVARRRKTA